MVIGNYVKFFSQSPVPSHQSPVPNLRPKFLLLIDHQWDLAY
ncbi:MULTISPECIES: hypothetical protein [unclassified Sphaerospermopsis]|nr:MULTISPECIES: hypothetical protein [unclassified Sphaerospermopsis]